ncbi:EcsC family protein [Algibacter mikhailovii]|uniref:Peptidase n=1 Tax=Algibacter mikhailovii TaxID=425498 RepID=A0A918VCI2_9FLAO|nr:EcsC family protein [Algibacter mikhailovii]GGZ88179.1 peptidase [Algibacter mikhailovii]
MSSQLDKHIISDQDLQAIKKAKNDMENLSWAILGVNKLGNTLETGIQYVPNRVLTLIQTSTEKMLNGILKANLLTISRNKAFKKPSNKTYKTVVAGTGAAGGFLGSTTGIGTTIFIAEMTLTTKFLMRTILDIARSQGEDIYSLEGQLQCLEVFALGGQSEHDDGIDTSYYMTRAALSSTMNKITASGIKSAINVAVNTASAVGSSAVTKFMTQIASRLSVLITEKFVAQAVPIAGAIGGSTINLIFINHFQKMATAHFTLRRLERNYGEQLVKTTYENIKLKQ